MTLSVALLLMLQLPDTTAMPAGELLHRAVQAAPGLEAANGRIQAAEARVRQVTLLTNPTLAAAVENLGSQRQVTGGSGWAGSEGQFVLGAHLPLGGDRGAARRVAGAAVDEARAGARGVEDQVRVEVLEAVAAVQRDRALLGHARNEAEGVEVLEAAIRLQAQLGRSSDGEAARLALARTGAWVTVARVEAALAASEAELVRLAGMPSGVVLHVVPPACTPDGGSGPGVLPELEAAEARIRGWDATGTELRAAAIPDLFPQVGVRRASGVDALYVGLQVDLPLFNRNQGARESARLEARAAEAEWRALEARLTAERDAAVRALAAVEAAGSRFDETWRGALDRSAQAAEARYTLGEGTLTELLDGRRARLEALGDYERWRAERVAWRALVARRSGLPITEQLLCDAPRPSPLESVR